jgi:hypothetical protein
VASDDESANLVLSRSAAGGKRSQASASKPAGLRRNPKDYSSGTIQPSKKTTPPLLMQVQERRLYDMQMQMQNMQMSDQASSLSAGTRVAKPSAAEATAQLLTVPSNSVIYQLLNESQYEWDYGAPSSSRTASAMDRAALIMNLFEFRSALDHSGDRRIVFSGTGAAASLSSCPLRDLRPVTDVLEANHNRAISIILVPNPAWLGEIVFRFTFWNMADPRMYHLSSLRGFIYGFRSVSTMCLPSGAMTQEHKNRVNMLLIESFWPPGDPCVNGVSFQEPPLSDEDLVKAANSVMKQLHSTTPNPHDALKRFVGRALSSASSKKSLLARMIAFVELARFSLTCASRLAGTSAGLSTDLRKTAAGAGVHLGSHLDSNATETGGAVSHTRTHVGGPPECAQHVDALMNLMNRACCVLCFACSLSWCTALVSSM